MKLLTHQPTLGGVVRGVRAEPADDLLGIVWGEGASERPSPFVTRVNGGPYIVLVQPPAKPAHQISILNPGRVATLTLTANLDPDDRLRGEGASGQIVFAPSRSG